MITAQIHWKDGGATEPIAVPDTVYHRASIMASHKLAGESLIREIIGEDVMPAPKCAIFSGTLECGSKIVVMKLNADYA